MYVVALANQKGGVAKTTSAANIADAAAERGQRVLLVDLDPQANATTLTDAQPREHRDETFGTVRQLTMSDALHHAQPRTGAPTQAGTVRAIAVAAGEHWASGLRVAPSSQDLAARGEEGWPGADRRLAVALDGVDELADLVVLDCGPTLGPLFLAALNAADGVLLVSEPADNALEGLPPTVQVLQEVRAQRGGAAPQLLGIVATNVPGHEARAAELLAQIRADYGERLWEVVPRRSIVRQAEGAHAPVRAMGRAGREVADAYDGIAGRVLEQVGLAMAQGAR